MTQNELNRAVAEATGETTTTIRDLGFSIADPAQVCHDPEPHANVVDWDELDQGRVGLFSQRPRRELALA